MGGDAVVFAFILESFLFFCWVREGNCVEEVSKKKTLGAILFSPIGKTEVKGKLVMCSFFFYKSGRNKNKMLMEIAEGIYIS